MSDMINYQNKTITVYFPTVELYDAVVEAAGDDRRSKSNYILSVLIKELGLKEREKNESGTNTE